MGVNLLFQYSGFHISCKKSDTLFLELENKHNKKSRKPLTHIFHRFKNCIEKNIYIIYYIQCMYNNYNNLKGSIKSNYISKFFSDFNMIFVIFHIL